MRNKFEKEEAIKLRSRDGLSIAEIKKLIHVPYQTIKRWIKDIPLTKAQDEQLAIRNPNYKRNSGAALFKQRSQERITKKQEEGRKIASSIKISKNDKMWVVGAMLYWGEGGKTRRTTIDFTNSDSDMITTFCKFLTEILRVEKHKIKVQIHCYKNHSTSECETFWLNSCGLKQENLNKTIVLNSSSSKRNLSYGTCKLRVYDIDRAQILFGFIKEMSGKDDKKLWG